MLKPVRLDTPEEAGSPLRPILSVRDLEISFRDGRAWRPVVTDVAFEISPRETLAVVGESGSGKSVTAMSLMRLLPKASARVTGSIVFDGRDLTRLSDEEMEGVRGNDVAMIFQEPMTSLNPVMTIGAQIAEGLRIHRGLGGAAAAAEAVRLVDRVRVPSAQLRVRDYPHQLSGGMRQRIMIAMALACRPKLLIADEPTTALDVTIQAQILELLRDIQDEYGMAMLFITHDMGVVAQIADRTLVMYHGKCVEAGETGHLFENPARPYTRSLLAAVPVLGSMKDSRLPKCFPLIDVETGARQPSKVIRSTLDEKAGPLLEVSGLKTRFSIRSGLFGRVSARVHAVENVDLSLQPGETLALVGESGSGKSTLGRTIIGLIPQSEGTIRFDGRPMPAGGSRENRHARQRMQMLLQDPFASLDPRQSIGAAIAEPMLVHGHASRSTVGDHVAATLRQVGLSPDMQSRYPHEFSGGQRQRICLARVLGLKPKLIIADECVSALDVSVKARVINLMLELQAELGLAYLFISHDLAVVERISHRIAVMYLGEIVEIGPRAEILGNPQHAYTRRLISAVPVPDPRYRDRMRVAEDTESRGIVRPVGFDAPSRRYHEVSPGHLVQVSDA